MAAGLGTRLRPLTERYAKAVLPIDGRPVRRAAAARAGCRGLSARSRSSSGTSASRCERLLGDGGAFGVRAPLRPAAAGRTARPTRSGRAGEEPPYLVLAADTVFAAGAIALVRAAGRPSGRRDRRSAPAGTAAGARPRRPRRACSRSGRAGAVLRRAAVGRRGARARASLPGQPPWELGNAFQAAIDAGEQIAAVEIGATRDLTAPLDLLRARIPLPEPPMTDAYDLFQQGRSHLKGGMAAQATVALEKAKKLEPDKASIREALGIAYFRIQRWREAEAEFRAVLELSPADDYAHYALGRALEKQGRDAEANGHYKLASVALAEQRALRRADHGARPG